MREEKIMGERGVVRKGESLDSEPARETRLDGDEQDSRGGIRERCAERATGAGGGQQRKGRDG